MANDRSMSSHGTDMRGLVAGANPGMMNGRFGRMFDGPNVMPGGALPPAALWQLATSMVKVDKGQPLTNAEPVDENPTIPAGYTYFGQFIDHDLTLDPTSFNTAERDTDALIDFRSPALDLDSVYGRGPDDQPYMYDASGAFLLTGPAPGSGTAAIGTKADLFRIKAGERDNVPVLGDKRNDENKIVSQIHGTIIALHNRVAGDKELLTRFGADLDNSASRFRTAARIVRWHYQWVVINDYLDRICEPGMVTEVLNPGGTPRLMHYPKLGQPYPYMPVEFSGAAFRLGHSMVRPSYSLNKIVVAPEGADPTQSRIPTFSRDKNAQNLNGFPGPLPREWGIDWGFFLDVPAGPNPQQNALKNYVLPQQSYRLDGNLVDPLTDLPEFFAAGDTPDLAKQIGAANIDAAVADGTARKVASVQGHLAFRNLLRGQMLGLPSGETVAQALGIVPLPAEVLWSAGSRLLKDPDQLGDDKKDWQTTTDRRKAVFNNWVRDNGPLSGNTPLWYYILREAEWYGVTKNPNDARIQFGGQHLGPVGSRIVAETLIGLLWLDSTSYLHDTRGFRPVAPIAGDDGKLDLARLITYALS